MSKPNKKRYKLSVVAAEAREKHPPIEIETDDGQVFTFDAPALWSDKAIDLATGPLDTAIEVMGVEQWEKFKAAGGSIALLNMTISQYAEDQGTTLGESSASTAS